ncbi:MAG: hypothetical protein JW841_14885 [Deltaproteobacteria bacterium]|nr:hypothetical protein [Deltaproteobacteria bacterium]
MWARSHSHLMACAIKAGRAKGMAEGKAEGRAEAILTILETRGLHLTVNERNRILECIDNECFNKWLQKALTVDDIEELFEK